MNLPGITHDPRLRSRVDSANLAGAEFPIQNLPLGAIRRDGEVHLAIAIGDHALDLAVCARGDQLDGLPVGLIDACQAPGLNALLGLGPGAWSVLRHRASELLRVDGPHPGLPELALPRRDDVATVLPMSIGDFTDFYASVHHATNVGSMFRPDNPLLPNYKWVPIGPHL